GNISDDALAGEARGPGGAGSTGLGAGAARMVLHGQDRALPDGAAGSRAAVCEWAGVPLPDTHLIRRCRQLTALFDGAASGLLPHLGARIARKEASAGWSRWSRRPAKGERRLRQAA